MQLSKGFTADLLWSLCTSTCAAALSAANMHCGCGKAHACGLAAGLHAAPFEDVCPQLDTVIWSCAGISASCRMICLPDAPTV